MRFILGYVTCCMMSPPCIKEDPSSHGMLDEESPKPVTISRRRKRTPTTGSSVDWQPSLFAIAEDKDNAVVVATTGKVEGKVNRAAVRPVKEQGSQRNVKRRESYTGRVNSQSRSYYDFSCDPMPMIVPAFSAAPFMF